MATVADRKIAPRENRASNPVARFAPYILAVYFAISAMWGVWRTDPIDTDAARHAMNGAFIYDLVRTGHLLHPVEYAQEYYGHLPALSMPFHPPLFPAIEAVFFAIFGVKLFTARLAVAVSVGVSALLLFRLTERSLGNRLLAICVTLTTFSLWTSQEVSRDVMLEYPAMAFALAALLCLRPADDFGWKRALLFAALASAAFWTKQHAAFLGGVILLYPITSWRWRLLLKIPYAAAIVLFGGAVEAYILLSHRFRGTGVYLAATSTSDVQWILTRTIPAYFSWIKEDLAGVGIVFLACAVLAYFAGLRRGQSTSAGLGLYWAWIASVALVLVDLGATSDRYLFFLFPATITIGYAWVLKGSQRLWGNTAANGIVSVFALIWLVTGYFVPQEFLSGPGAAANAVLRNGSARVLYAGEADGNFIFNVRALDPSLEATVIPSGKLPPATFQGGQLESFCRTYGVEWVVLENAVMRHSWSHLHGAPPPFLNLEQTIPLQSNRVRWETGSLEVFRVQGAVGKAERVLKIPVPKLGSEISVSP
jgi:4-amino-4-deoxy-L-arabinose transferase-like glycosyltransferase